jgi:hypothetical protein
LDLGTVYAYADAFSNALLAEDEDVFGSSLRPSLGGGVPEAIAGYLCDEPSIVVALELLPRPIERTELLSVSPPVEGDECISVIRVMGEREEVLLQAVWIESGIQPLIESVQILERKAR